MSLTKKMVLAAGALALLAPAMAFAQDEVPESVQEALAATSGMRALAVGLGAGLATIGASLGLGLAAKAGLESIARQPEAGAVIGTNMLIMAAFIEGATLFAIAVAFLILILG